MFAHAKLADLEIRVKPDEPRQREIGVAESTLRNLGHWAGRITIPMTSTTSTARCGPACRVVGPVRSSDRPYPDFGQQKPRRSGVWLIKLRPKHFTLY
jgi:hypothetical protein